MGQHRGALECLCRCIQCCSTSRHATSRPRLSPQIFHKGTLPFSSYGEFGNCSPRALCFPKTQRGVKEAVQRFASACRTSVPQPSTQLAPARRTQREDEAVLHHTWALLAEKVLVTSVTPECQGIISYFHSIVQSSHT